ncbi:amidase family protein [Halococcus hamelinensis]|uniref:Amidase n=1 Tax=Halococcus hamelinensis 100A6 TaxID=1132509 RepID=M0LUL4_9EURY|nr:amidase family protein [Halococcus hamelinensis]EMA37262.1 amidase [Halococcus hamelinensis 100A6]
MANRPARRSLSLPDNGYEYSALEYHQANVLRSRAYEGIRSLLDEYDLLFTPTLAAPPFEKGACAPRTIDRTAPASDLETFLTWRFNLTGHPAAFIPAGFSADGLPLGAQIIGSRFEETTILTASDAIERRRPWADDYPTVI